VRARVNERRRRRRRRKRRRWRREGESSDGRLKTPQLPTWPFRPSYSISI
jgi:hypothetical protein